MTYTRAQIEAASENTKFLVTFSIEHYIYFEESIILNKQDTLKFMDDNQYIDIARKEEVELTFKYAIPSLHTNEFEKFLNGREIYQTIVDFIHN